MQKLVPTDVTVSAPGQRTAQVQRMLGGFELNLGALSLISLLVGMFLIYNTIAASVVRRRVETGILRALGATRLEVQCLFLGEALLFGAVGVIAGIFGGTLLARYLLGREIARVISSLYTLVNVDRLALSPLLVGAAFFFGLGSVLTAAWLPAREGARVDPVAALSLGLGATRASSRRASPRWLALGALALVLAAICSVVALRTGPAWLSFGAAFFVLLGFAFFAPFVTTAGAKLAENLTQRRRDAEEKNGAEKSAHLENSSPSAPPRLGVKFLLQLAAQNLGRSLHRTAVIVAALMAAIAMTVSISTMIFSFRHTVEVWIERAIVADLFLAPRANETLGNGAFFPAEILRELRADPDVAALDTVREIGVTVRGDRVSMVAVEGTNRNRLAFVGGHDREKQAAFHHADTVLISEPFARRYHVWDGDTIPLSTPRGIVDFTVGGVYYDYTRDSGIIVMDRSNFDHYWNDPRVMSVALYLKDPTQLDRVAADLRARFNQKGEFLIYSNRALRTRVFEIFSQTFRITGVLRGIAVVVAVIGIFLTLTTLVAEREREIGVLRALGASRGQIAGLVLGESALIGLISSALGVAAGLTLSVVLTLVINQAFFGWSIQLVFPWATLLVTPLWIVLAALGAGVLPARRAARVPIAGAVRAE
ncbi:MAG: FtsX-like permease family protein [Verrucomicrobia bacterium]|nr:FtsX-like permease family protein [Verrucomicrobiota bacterium]